MAHPSFANDLNTMIRPLLGSIRRFVCRKLKAFTARIALRNGVEQVLTHHIYVPPLLNGSFVLDVGANCAQFSHEIARRFECRCAAVEGSPKLFDAIVESAKVSKWNQVVAGEPRLVRFFESQNCEANSLYVEIADGFGIANSFEVTTISFRALLNKIGVDSVDLLKLDIEGAELDLLESLDDRDFAAISQITVEFHHVITALESTERVLALRAKLRQAGFIHLDMGGAFGCDDLFIHPVRCNVGCKRLLTFKVMQFLFLPVVNCLEALRGSVSGR